MRFALPDIPAFVANQTNGSVTWVPMPPFNPKHPNELPAPMKLQRFHFWITAFIVTTMVTVFFGTMLLTFGVHLRQRWFLVAYQQLEPSGEHNIIKLADRRLFSPKRVALMAVVPYLATIFGAVGYSAYTSRLSRRVGLNWEVYYGLFLAGCVALLSQAGAVVAIKAKRGVRYSAGAFAEACFTSLMPFFSDAVDSLKDAIFGGLCMMHDSIWIKFMGVVAWGYIAHLHVTDFVDHEELRNEMFNTYWSVWRAPTKIENTATEVNFKTKLLVLAYKQTTTAKKAIICKEEAIQGIFAMFLSAYDCFKGREVSPFIVVCNIGFPIAKYIFAVVGNPLFKPRVAPWLEQQVEQALTDQDTDKAKLYLPSLRDDALLVNLLQRFRDHGSFQVELLARAGLTATEFREAGYTAAEALDAGFVPDELLVVAGYTAAEARDAGLDV